MASITNSASFAKSNTAARPAMRVSGELRQLLVTALAIVLLYTFTQLALASVASSLLKALDNQQKAIANAEIQRDTWFVRVEELKNLSVLERRAREKGYRPATNVEFMR